MSLRKRIPLAMFLALFSPFMIRPEIDGYLPLFLPAIFPEFWREPALIGIWLAYYIFMSAVLFGVITLISAWRARRRSS